jgi:hypothetical protein
MGVPLKIAWASDIAVLENQASAENGLPTVPRKTGPLWHRLSP